MTKYQVEFESDPEIDELFLKIDKLQTQLSEKHGIEWHTLSYFYDETGAYWRFDWEYMWDRTHDNLKTILKMAIEAGTALL